MVIGSSMLFRVENCLHQHHQEDNLLKKELNKPSFVSNNGLKRKLDSMEEDARNQQICCDDELVDEEACCLTRNNCTSNSSRISLSFPHFEDNDLFREVKRVKTSLTLSHLKSTSSTIDSMEQDEDGKENVPNNIIPSYCILKTPKSPPKSNTEKSFSNIMIKEIWRKKLQSSLMSQSTGVSQLPRTDINLHNEYDFDEPEERAVIPNSIPREELMRRLRTRIDSASNGRQHRFDDPHSTGISDEFDMADD